MSRTIFEQLQYAYKLIKTELKKVSKKDKEQIQLLKGQRDLLNEIGSYIYSCEWLTQTEKKRRIKRFLDFRCEYTPFIKDVYCTDYGMSKAEYKEYYIKQYEGCNDVLAFEEYKLGFEKSYKRYEKKCENIYDSAKESISYANKKAKEKIGSKTIDMILAGRVKEARLEFYSRTNRLKFSNYLVDAVAELLPDPVCDNPPDIEECKEELDFLRMYSQAVIQEQIKQLDISKLAYLRYILEGGNSKYSTERSYLIDLLAGKIDTDNLISKSYY